MKTTTLLQKGLIAAGAATAIGLSMSAPAQAMSLIGDNVNIEHFFPDTGALYESKSTTVASDSSDLVTLIGSLYSVDMGSSGANIKFSDFGNYWNVSSFNGVKISGLDFDDLSNIIGVTFETNWTGFDASRVSWTADSVSFNFQGLAFSTEYINATFITDSATAVPTPAAVLPVLGGMLAAARRRKNVEVQEA